MSRSPQTPLHSRHPSSIDVSFPASSSPAGSVRRASKSSFQDPLTPLRTSMNEAELAMLGGGGGGQDHSNHNNGLGNLADELADALSEDDDDDEDGEYYEDGEGPSIVQHGDDDDEDDNSQEAEANNGGGFRHSSVGGDAAAAAVAANNNNNNNNNKHTAQSSSLSIPPPNGGRGHHRRTGSAYDGSEYGSESDLDIPGMPPSLVARIDAVESLARRGTESTGGPADGVFKRLTDGLRDLGSQSSVEGSTTR